MQVCHPSRYSKWLPWLGCDSEWSHLSSFLSPCMQVHPVPSVMQCDLEGCPKHCLQSADDSHPLGHSCGDGLWASMRQCPRHLWDCLVPPCLAIVSLVWVFISIGFLFFFKHGPGWLLVGVCMWVTMARKGVVCSVTAGIGYQCFWLKVIFIILIFNVLVFCLTLSSRLFFLGTCKALSLALTLVTMASNIACLSSS